MNTTLHNLNAAKALNESFDPGNAVDGTINVTFRGTNIYWAPIQQSLELPLIHASASLLSIEPSIDNTISGNDPFLIIRWGAKAEEMEAKDWEGDDCFESQSESNVRRSAVLEFTYGNISQTLITQDNVVPLPQVIVDAMRQTSGADILNVSMDAKFNFTYTMDDRRPTHEGCSMHLANYSSVLYIHDQMNYTSSGNRTLFFLRAPLLNEQWFRNNRFDMIVFSNSRIYKARIFEDGLPIRNITLYYFNITTDNNGLQRIVSVPSNESGFFEHEAFNAPDPISEDGSTYFHLYEFNQTYEGIGEHDLELEVISFFGTSSAYQSKILSRSLTYSGNLTEIGNGSDPLNARKSKPDSDSGLAPVVISFGMIGLLILLLLIKRMIK